MTILSVCQDAAKEMGLTAPSSIYGSTEKFAGELASLANECGPYIAKFYDWRKFVTLNSFSGDGSTTAFDMPSDYDRMIENGQVFRASTILPMEGVQDLNDWQQRRLQGLSSAIGEWIILGGQMQIYDAMASTDSAKFYYCSNKIVIDTDNVTKSSFTADTDSFRLSERLLKLCLKWHWRAMKKLDSADEQEEFEIALAQEIKRDKGPRVIAVGTPRISDDAEMAYPGVIVA
jgi:hypothetical protein